MNCIAALKTQRLFAASVVLAACCLFAVPLRADNVINTINGAAGFADPGESGTGSHSFSGTAFLMNRSRARRSIRPW